MMILLGAGETGGVRGHAQAPHTRGGWEVKKTGGIIHSRDCIVVKAVEWGKKTGEWRGTEGQISVAVV